jgi:DNA polymerase III delta prime subunit
MTPNNNHTLLTEKYRPQSLSDFIGSEEIKQRIQSQLDSNNIQNYIFYGPAGTGKTTLAKIIANTANCEYILINASDERGIDTVREKIVGFASTRSFAPLKLIILEEYDSVGEIPQKAMRHIIEEYSSNTRFIFTCNYLEKIIDPIQSRCQVINIVPPSKKDIAVHLDTICEEEIIKITGQQITEIVHKCYPDIRKMLNIIQAGNYNGTFNLDNGLIIMADYIDQIIDELKQSKPNFNTIRQIITDSEDTTYTSLYKTLFDRATEYLPGKEGSVAILVNKYQYQAQTSIDKSINVLAMLYSIIKLK